MNIIISRLKRINSCIGIRNKLLVCLLTLFEILLFPVNTLLYAATGKKIHPAKFILLTDITVKNTDGLFFCRKKELDIYYIDPNWEGHIKPYFNLTNGVFIDVGAHIGKYSISVGRAKNFVVAIEADSSYYKVLEKNIALNNLQNVRAVNAACYSKTGKIKFYEATSSVKKKSGKPTTINAKTLDFILSYLGINHVDLLKIDVEGAEAEVLKGALQTLKKSRDNIKIIFEAWDKVALEKCARILRGLGFKITKLSTQDYLAYANH